MAAFLFALCGTAHAEDNDLQSWLTGVVKLKLSEDWHAALEATGRFGDDLSRLTTNQFKGALIYNVTPAVSAGAGYGYSVNHKPSGDVEEHRIWQDIQWKPESAAMTSIALRTRLEQRFIDAGNDVALRLRQQARATRPLHEGYATYVYGAAEGFFNLNDTDWGAESGFEKMRLSGGLGFGMTKQIKMEAGYLNEYRPRSGAPDRVNHVLTMTWTFKP